MADNNRAFVVVDNNGAVVMVGVVVGNLTWLSCQLVSEIKLNFF